jgi:methyl-accepting chemotaxis protein
MRLFFSYTLSSLIKNNTYHYYNTGITGIAIILIMGTLKNLHRRFFKGALILNSCKIFLKIFAMLRGNTYHFIDIGNNFNAIIEGITKVVEAIRELLNIFINLSRGSDEIMEMLQFLDSMSSRLRNGCKDITENVGTINTTMYDISKCWLCPQPKFNV